MPRQFNSSPGESRPVPTGQSEGPNTTHVGIPAGGGQGADPRALTVWQRLVVAIVAAGALFVMGGMVWYVSIHLPETTFHPKDVRRTIERDPYYGEVPSVPVAEFFSEAAIQGLRNGDSLSVTFRIRRDPRNGGRDTEQEFHIEKASGPGFDNRARRELVDRKLLEFPAYIARFNEPIPIHRSIEIGVDETEGTDSGLRELVRSVIAELAPGLTSDRDTVTLFLFRLSDTDHLNYRSWTLRPGMRLSEAVSVLERGLEWLLQDRGSRATTSLATGLFNHLKRNAGLQKRDIYIFSDGMENNKATVDFYELLRSPLLLEKPEWPDLDRRISALEQIPDLSAAEVSWYFPPRRWPQYRTVHRYWAHVLTSAAKARTVNIVY